MEASLRDSVPGAPPASAPVEQRIQLLDALRGFALLGVLLVHTNNFATETPAAYAVVLDLWDDRLVRILATGKAQTLFTVMFGVSFAIQMSRLESHLRDAAGIYRRRLCGLLVIGLLHMSLLPQSDILSYYALGGFALLFLRSWSTRALVGIGLLLALLAIPTASLVSGMTGSPQPRPEGLGHLGLPALYQQGSYPEIMRQSWPAIWFVDHIGWGLFAILPYVVGRFMLGVGVMRAGLLTEPWRHRCALTQAAVIGLPAGILLTISEWMLRIAAGAGWIRDPQPWQVVVPYFAQAGTLLLTAAYTALFALAWQTHAWRRLLIVFAPVGQTAVSNYLLQSVFNSLVFFGFGLGLLDRLDAAGCLLAALAFFALQCFVSYLWLRRFQFGPVEWLWRAWTYKERPAWRRALIPAAKRH